MIFDGAGSPLMQAMLVVAFTLFLLGEAIVANDLVASSCNNKIDEDGKVRRALNWSALGVAAAPAVAALIEMVAQIVRYGKFAAAGASPAV